MTATESLTENGRRSCRVRCLQVSKAYAARSEGIFGHSAGSVQALAEVTLTVEPGEFVCLVGPSGCGKSTLLRILAELIRPTTGTVEFEPEQVFGGPKHRPVPRSALVFQDAGLFPWMKIEDNVAFGLEAQGIARSVRLTQARGFLDRLGLGAFAGHFPHELSVGMRQRVALARALLTDAPLLLMDEPFSALDAQSKLVLQEDLLHIWASQGRTVVYVTHDIEEAVLLADRILVMSGRPGRIQEDIRVPMSRPRDLRDRDQPEVRDAAWHIWNMIEREVRLNLGVRA